MLPIKPDGKQRVIMRALNRVATPEPAIFASLQLKLRPTTHLRSARSRIFINSRCQIRSSVARASVPVEHAATEHAATGAAAAAGASATSLIPQTLEEMESDVESAATRDLLKRRGQAALTREERRQRQRSLDAIDAPPFNSVLKVSLLPLCSSSPIICPVSCPYKGFPTAELQYTPSTAPVACTYAFACSTQPML